LKNKAKQIGIYKKTVKKQIVFDGDVVESFEHNILKQQIKKEVRFSEMFKKIMSIFVKFCNINSKLREKK